MSDEAFFNGLKQSIIDGNKDHAVSLAHEAVRNGMDLLKVIEKGYVPGIQEVGVLWEQGEYFLPELISSAEAMKAAMSVLQPELEKAELKTQSLGTLVIGTVEGDIHDIGKNLVASMLSANGFEIIDLGADVKIEKFIEQAESANAQMICVSALLTTTMLGQKNLVEVLKQKKLKDKFKVMVGGAPVTQKWAEDIGADGYAENAMSAVREAKKILGK